MMDNSRPSLLPIITSVIGSGLLLFVLNNIAADINLPHIYLQVNRFSIHDDISLTSNRYRVALYTKSYKT
jgi:hypothetical protein